MVNVQNQMDRVLVAALVGCPLAATAGAFLAFALAFDFAFALQFTLLVATTALVLGVVVGFGVAFLIAAVSPRIRWRCLFVSVAVCGLVLFALHRTLAIGIAHV